MPAPVNKDPWESLIEKFQNDLALIQSEWDENGVHADIDLQTIFEQYAVSLEELKQTEEELRIQNEDLISLRNAVEAERNRYRDLFENAPEGYLITDLQGVITHANRAASQKLQVGQVFLTGKPLSAFVASHDRLAFKKRLDDLVQEENIQLRTVDTPGTPFTVAMKQRSGSQVYIELTYTPEVELPPGFDHPQMVGLRWLLHDVTARKQAEELKHLEALRSEMLEEFSRTLYAPELNVKELIPFLARLVAGKIGDTCLVHLLSEDGAWLAPAFCFHKDGRKLVQDSTILLEMKMTPPDDGFLGRVMHDGQGISITSISPEDRQVLIGSGLEALLKRYNPTSLVAVKLGHSGGPQGTLLAARNSLSQPYGKGDVSALQSLADRASLAIANQKLMQDLEWTVEEEQSMRMRLIRSEKSSAIGRMVSSVSHEINNPLQTVKNCLFLAMQETKENTSMREYLELAQDEVIRLSRIVQQLREISRPDFHAARSDLALADLVNDVRMLMAYHMKGNKVVWEQEYIDPSIMVFGISDQLKQVFLNLSLNAVEAMQPRGGAIQVQPILDEGAKRIGVVFRDSGPGMTNEVKRRLFEPFYTTKEKGLGLGLAICKDIIDQHQGEITVESEQGKGASFTVWLPLAR